MEKQNTDQTTYQLFQNGNSRKALVARAFDLNEP